MSPKWLSWEVTHLDVSSSSSLMCWLSPWAQLGSASRVSLLAGHEDTHIPLCVCCQEVLLNLPNCSLGICRRSWTVFLLQCYLGKNCSPLPYFSLFLGCCFCIAWYPTTLHSKGKADKHPFSCLGKGFSARGGFRGEPLCHIGIWRELGAVGRRSCGHLTSMAALSWLATGQLLGLLLLSRTPSAK